MRRTMIQQFDQYVKLNKKIPPEILTSLAGIDEAGRLGDTIAAHLPLKLEQKQEVLEMFDVKHRLEHLLKLVEGELDILQVEKRIRGRVKRQMEKSQREYYLNEQVKAIQKELGEMEEGADLDEIEKKIKQARMPKDARKKAEAELKKLRLMSPMSAEATVVRNYIDSIVSLPWRKKSKINTRSSSAWTSSRRRSCVSWARPAWARLRSGSRSLARRTGSSFGCRWAACVTKPRSAATAGPTSARCPGRSSRT
jgi:ATP-dependent Lon protease